MSGSGVPLCSGVLHIQRDDTTEAIPLSAGTSEKDGSLQQLLSQMESLKELTNEELTKQIETEKNTVGKISPVKKQKRLLENQQCPTCNRFMKEGHVCPLKHQKLRRSKDSGQFVSMEVEEEEKE
eukprot:TRINITY_DN1413_c0_g1_i1.p1 TRINITY_DN1413_c0_g1~~TRINITY_DN1413_c0_g1_i1.p1  ORF type:complete len:125 (+),score=23.82 TRINITY_DN1413_c0_g1_i1:187-561(+)